MNSDTHCALKRLDVLETLRRRPWSAGKKERIALERTTGPRQIAATALRHGITRSQLLACRRALAVEPGVVEPGSMKPGTLASGFVPMMVTPNSGSLQPTITGNTPVPGRVAVVFVSGRRIIVDGAFDVVAVLTLARGLETFR